MVSPGLIDALVAVCIGLAGAGANAADRSKAQRAEFVRSVPCPETGVTRATCPGWEVDHVVPLCAGGPDRPANMQWLLIADHKSKTRQDVKGCRLRRPAGAASGLTLPSHSA